jgi:hypothetical protein
LIEIESRGLGLIINSYTTEVTFANTMLDKKFMAAFYLKVFFWVFFQCLIVDSD